MTEPISILVVDDSVAIRSILRGVLSRDPDIEVVGVAANGRIALKKIEELNPDLMILDIQMPEMDGLETLRRLRQRRSKLPVIVFSGQSEFDARVTVEAMALGAVDCVAKPSSVSNEPGSVDTIGDQLIPMIKSICRGEKIERTPVAPPPKRAPTIPPRRPDRSARIELVVIGSSTGGPNALVEVMSNLPADLPVPVLIVQHMPPGFTRHLADRLNQHCPLAVSEGVSGEAITPGCAWVAPGDRHMIAARQNDRQVIRINRDAPENSCRPSVDPLFRSAVEWYGSGVLAVILTGMGNDGLSGCEKVYEAGGHVLVQDEQSSVVWGMPGYVARAGLAEEVLPLGQIGPKIASRCRDASCGPSPSASLDGAPSAPLTTYARGDSR